MLKKPKISTGIKIRDYLRKGPNYPWAIWHFLHVELKVTQMRYASFCSYFKVLEKLSLVIRVAPPKTEPAVPLYRKKYHFKSTPRAWYSLNPHKVDSEAWLNPQRALFPKTFKVTGRPRGRPAGSKNKKKRTTSATVAGRQESV